MGIDESKTKTGSENYDASRNKLPKRGVSKKSPSFILKPFIALKNYVKRMRSGDTDAYHKTLPDGIILKRLLTFLKPYMKDVRLLVFLLMVTSVTNLVYPLGMTIILQIVFQTATSGSNYFTTLIIEFVNILGKTQMSQLETLALIMIIVLFINFMSSRAYQYNINKLSQYLVNDLRNQLFNHLQNLSMDFYNEMPAGKLMSRVTNDVSMVQALISTQIIQAIGDIFTLITTITIMVSMTWQLTLLILAFAPLFGVAFYFFALRSRFYWSKERKIIAEVTGILQESISGSKTIKAFVTEAQNIETFNAAILADKNVSLQAARVNAFLQPVTQLLVACAIGLVLFFGSILIQTGQLNITLMLGYVLLATQFMNPLNDLGNIFNSAQSALAAGDRILGILDTKPTIIDTKSAIILPPIRGEIVYENVEFEYVKDLPVLQDINLKALPNQRVALVGFTGAGKSTFVSLLSRFYDPTHGRILIDGYDLKTVTLSSLRSQMGIVLQDTFLFSGTIMENVRYGKIDATDDEVIEASKKVGAHPFIMNLKDEYKTDVRERGSLLSVGQRQLISFARALLANPPLLILDEATSSVDPYTELKIQEALEVLLKGRNSFVIAHRLSTILNSDLILVMENGRIIQRGTHEQLIEEGGLYKHLYELQFIHPEEKETLEKSS